MKIVGVGCGPGMLTEEAITVIRSARLIVGSERAINHAKSHISGNAQVRIIEDYSLLHQLPEDAIVLSTGDPMISGLGYLRGDITPGISSIQLGAAKTGISLTNLFIITAHGRDHDKAINDCCEMHQKGRKTCIIADPQFPIITLCHRLSELSAPARIIICENLGYPDERIDEGTSQNPPVSKGNMYILFVTNVVNLKE
ncbi:MAG: cobalt-precorrin-7 (C(5))-methyltransferase [Methanomicrobiales archaeon]|nr:cobalt-precorrin-7 (C(5))-methyltransferase [Methanomicrobiales archaeon]